MSLSPKLKITSLVTELTLLEERCQVTRFDYRFVFFLFFVFLFFFFQTNR